MSLYSCCTTTHTPTLPAIKYIYCILDDKIVSWPSESCNFVWSTIEVCTCKSAYVRGRDCVLYACVVHGWRFKIARLTQTAVSYSTCPHTGGLGLCIDSTRGNVIFPLTCCKLQNNNTACIQHYTIYIYI